MTATISSNPNIVQKDSFLTLHYRLAGPKGDVVNTFAAKPATINLGAGELAPALEQCLIGLAEGEHKSFQLLANQAFGEKQAAMQQWLPKDLLNEIGNPQEQYHVGEVVEFPTPDGNGKYAGAVIAVQPDKVLFDFNHPLSGMPVVFEVQIIGVL